MGDIELALPLFVGGFLVGLLVGPWWTGLIPILFGVFMWLLWSGDREVDAVKAGVFCGAISTAGTAIGLLLRAVVDSDSALRRSRPRWGRWARLVIGLDPKDPSRPTKAREDGQSHHEQQPS